MPAPAIPQLTPKAARELLEQCGAEGSLLDIREPWELALAQVEGSLNIPMGELPARLGELNSAHTYVVICHHGNRSQQVAAYMNSHGFPKVMNLAGGIDAWAEEFNPLPRY